MNVLEQAESVRAQLRVLTDLIKNEGIRQRVHQRFIRIQSVSEKIEPLATASVELSAVGRPVPRDLELKLVALKKDVASGREAVRKDVTNLTGDSIVETLQKIEQVLLNVEQNLSAQWVGFVRQDVRLPAVSEELLRALESLGAAFRQDCEQIRNLRASIENLSERQLPEKGDVDRLAIAARELQRAWEGLGSGTLTDDVRDFLMNTGAPEGAPLSNLTGEVLEWLAQHSLIERFIIRQAGA